VAWPEESQGWPVWVEVGNSVDEILAPAYLATEIKAPNAMTVGVMLDADVEAGRRYERVRQLCSILFRPMPLETFLRYLVPIEQQPLWRLACDSVAAAVSTGAGCRDAHIAKAQLYTWLAWQDPPGYSPGLALTRKILDPQSSYAALFVRWFRELYQV
jgi:hypothetical protein